VIFGAAMLEVGRQVLRAATAAPRSEAPGIIPRSAIHLRWAQADHMAGDFRVGATLSADHILEPCLTVRRRICTIWYITGVMTPKGVKHGK